MINMTKLSKKINKFHKHIIDGILYSLGIISAIFIFSLVYSSVKNTIFINNKTVSLTVTPTGNPTDKFIINRDLCDKQKTLDLVKYCTGLIKRDDGGFGTGFVIKKGYLLTNKHVIEGANKLTIWNNGKEHELKVWNYSSLPDLAVLKFTNEIQTEICNWFDSTKLQTAEELYAVGWPNEPYGESTVTKGIFSRLNSYSDGPEFIQTDAAINPGNSGGPLVNECGVVGVNTVKQSWSDENTPSEGFGLALSSNYIHNKVDDLINQGSENKTIPQVNVYKEIDMKESTKVLDTENIKSYLNDLYRVRSSWKQAGSNIDQEKLNKLIDSLNRQIDFCNHLVNKLSNGERQSNDDVNMWNAVIRMSYESSLLTKDLNRR
jgi:S1-C subfamily serine protease